MVGRGRFWCGAASKRSQSALTICVTPPAVKTPLKPWSEWPADELAERAPLAVGVDDHADVAVLGVERPAFRREGPQVPRRSDRRDERHAAHVVPRSEERRVGKE